ncbi:hypothetical protein [Hathewaya massiliensis]|uniref:hypothetical protein n=1 Tax=Hathewaya massiliensis TaxID=1964382 RepID=UPI00115A2B36|nr:hypothetical protein [Hathewaya massiliensis]
MAWYYGTFSCGHEGRVDIIGPVKDREWKKENAFSKMCPDCYEKYLQQERERKQLEAEEKAKEMELPDLTGTPKQVAWANTIRQEFIDKVNKIDENELKRYERLSGELHGLKESEVKCIIDYMLLNKIDAKYWIENRGKVIQLIVTERKNAIKTEEKVIEQKQEKEVKLESTVFPESKITNAVAEITYSDDKIQVKFEKNEGFREIVKGLGYKWEGVWERKITMTTGTAEDRAAELGNKLLNAGFPICILEETVRNNAINAEYEEECTRWIMKRKDKNKLVVKWEGYSDKMYNLAKSLPGARWDNGMLVDIGHYKEVEEFARLYSFKFSPGALEAIEKYKEELSKVEKVAPAEVTEETPKDGLEEILKSNDDILDDLRED